MDLAKTLVRSVVRSFYSVRDILVIDALVLHSALRDDDLAYLMNMNTKDLHKVCATLRDARFLRVHTRPEIKEGQQRPVNRMYYYIDYRQAIDAIKWRVYKIDKEMQGVTVPANERKEYFCDRAGCMAEYTLMEVLDKPSERGFLCHICSSVLRHDPEGKTGGHKQSTRMNNQLRFITDLLPEIDSVVIPDNTFDVAIRAARPVERDSLHQVAASVAVEPGHHRATVKGMANVGPKSIEISVTADDGPTESEKEAERLRKEKHAAQNALPQWISQSTITGEAYELLDAGKRGAAAALLAAADGGDGGPGSKKEVLDADDHAEIDDYFARLKREQEAAEARQTAIKTEEEEDEDEDDEEDEFEDVVAASTSNSSSGATPAVTTPAGAGPATATATTPTPVAAAATAALGGTVAGAGGSSSQPVVPSPLGKSSLKRDASSGPGSGENSPPGTGTPGSDGRPVKKVKLEEPAAAAAAAAPVVIDLSGESDEDDVEFEDV